MEVNTPTTSRTITEVIPAVDNVDTPEPVLHLRLHKPKSKKAVQWDEGTVDNEHLNRKKSKCCCIYVKPLEFGESSSEEEDECENCHGHVELKKKNRKKPTDDESKESDGDGGPNDKPTNKDDSPTDANSNPNPEP